MVLTLRSLPCLLPLFLRSSNLPVPKQACSPSRWSRSALPLRVVEESALPLTVVETCIYVTPFIVVETCTYVTPLNCG